MGKLQAKGAPPEWNALGVQDRQSLQQIFLAQGLSEVAFRPLKSGDEEIGQIVSARRDLGH